MALAVGTVVDGRYTLESRLGEGAFGEVWRARDGKLASRLVAIKFLKLEHVDRPELVARFDAEADALSLLQHPNVVGVVDRGQWEGQRYLATEFVEGVSLLAWLDRHRHAGTLPELGLVAALFDQLCLGVHAAHSVRTPGPIVHRDLKPENVLLRELPGEEYVPKVLDFGIAQLGERKGTRTGMLMGTPLYMAPEQAMGQSGAIGPWSDVFSLGVILVEMLTLRAQLAEGETWWGTSLQSGAAVRTLLREMRADVPAPVWDVAAAALHARRADRIPDAGALRAALRAAWSGTAQTLSGTSNPSAPEPVHAPHEAPAVASAGERAASVGAAMVASRTATASAPAGPGNAPSRAIIAAGAAIVALAALAAFALRRGPRSDTPQRAVRDAGPGRASTVDSNGAIDGASRASPRDPGGAALGTDPDLSAFVRRWSRAVIDWRAAEPLAEFYTEHPRFRGAGRGATPGSVQQYWSRFLNEGGTFRVDWARTTWSEEDPDAEPGASLVCGRLEGAEGPVLKVRAWATEFSPFRVAEVGCPRLEGVYLLRLRRVSGQLRICYETWSTREGLCASCPTARACQSLDAGS